MFRSASLILSALATITLAPLNALQAQAQTTTEPAMVLAAASLQESLNAAADSWRAKGHPRPRISFAGSSALARQIEAGAPADLFISADEPWMDSVQAKGLLRKGTRISFLQNSLVMIAPKQSNVHIQIGRNMPLAQRLGTGRLAVADPSSVPAGIYAKEALTYLNVWGSVRNRLAPAENVRAAMGLVSRGAAPIGIVYSTDAKADQNVRILGQFPRNSHKPISYPIATLASSRNPEGDAFRRYLISQEGKAVFRRFGFGIR